MGCYNTIWIRCPQCGIKHNFQSKGGSCAMCDYEVEDALYSDLLYIDGKCCDCACGHMVRFKLNTPYTID